MTFLAGYIFPPDAEKRFNYFAKCNRRTNCGAVLFALLERPVSPVGLTRFENPIYERDRV